MSIKYISILWYHYICVFCYWKPGLTDALVNMRLRRKKKIFARAHTFLMASDEKQEYYYLWPNLLPPMTYFNLCWYMLITSFKPSFMTNKSAYKLQLMWMRLHIINVNQFNCVQLCDHDFAVFPTWGWGGFDLS